MNTKNLKNIFGIASIVFAVIGVIILAVGLFVITDDALLFLRVMSIIISVAVLALAAEFVYMYVVENDASPNYFLYDPNKQRNIDVSEMNFDVIYRKMNGYLSGYASSEGKLWTDRILESPNLDMEAKFKPAVAYRLLFGLADRDVDQGWSCFENASVETVEFVCAALESNGDNEVAKTIRHMKNTAPVNMKHVRDYLVNNKGYLKTKLCNYVYDNIALFYENK